MSIATPPTKPPSDVLFPNNLRVFRLAAHLQQHPAAERIGTSRARLSLYETGRTLPTWETARAMMRVYRARLDELYPDPDLSRRIAESNTPSEP